LFYLHKENLQLNFYDWRENVACGFSLLPAFSAIGYYFYYYYSYVSYVCCTRQTKRKGKKGKGRLSTIKKRSGEMSSAAPATTTT